MNNREMLIKLIKANQAYISILEDKVKYCEEHKLYGQALDYLNEIEQCKQDITRYLIQLEELEHENK